MPPSLQTQWKNMFWGPKTSLAHLLFPSVLDCLLMKSFQLEGSHHQFVLFNPAPLLVVFIIFPLKRWRYHLIGLFILWLYLLSSQFGVFLQLPAPPTTLRISAGEKNYPRKWKKDVSTDTLGLMFASTTLQIWQPNPVLNGACISDNQLWFLSASFSNKIEDNLKWATAGLSGWWKTAALHFCMFWPPLGGWQREQLVTRQRPHSSGRERGEGGQP